MVKIICVFVAWFFVLGCFYLIMDGLDKIKSQRQAIVKLETKVMWLENGDDFLLAIEQLPPLIQAELKAMNELIKQGKNKQYRNR